MPDNIKYQQKTVGAKMQKNQDRQDKSWGSKKLPNVNKEQVSGHLMK